MGRYIDAIRKLEQDSRALLDEIHRTFRLRRESAHKFRDWERATERFHTRRSELDHLIEKCWPSSGAVVEPHLREFMFDYIEVDPQFYRSGYIMEKVLQRIKRLPLMAEEKAKVQALLLNRIRNKAQRNFRQICRLIPIIDGGGLKAIVAELAMSADPSVRYRAGFALSYFRE